MLENKWDTSSFTIVSQTEMENDPDTICDRIEHGEGPFLISSDDGQQMVMMGWEEYWNLFGLLHPPRERERMEEECRRQRELCKEDMFCNAEPNFS